MCFAHRRGYDYRRTLPRFEAYAPHFGQQRFSKEVAPEDSSMQFHILSFEGPDAYARAGGIASRITGLMRALAEAAYETHLWFVGDPALPAPSTASIGTDWPKRRSS